MALKDTFCSSPWFHIGIDYNGTYFPCRWQSPQPQTQSINSVTPLQFFNSSEMKTIRENMINGVSMSMCNECYDMDKHSKPSGRARQLLKTGIDISNFENTLMSSSYFEQFKTNTVETPADWQINLSNYCNSACVYCPPFASSRVASQYTKLGWPSIKEQQLDSNEDKVNQLVNAIALSPKTGYIHLLGGETLITPGFPMFLEKLSALPNAKDFIIGLTTNLTVFDDKVIQMLSSFKEVHVGFSIEANHPVNNYVRWPSKIDNILANLQKWQNIKQDNWIYQFRITPTWVSMLHLPSVFELAEASNISIESCNFLEDPKWLKVSLLPIDMRKEIINKFATYINNRQSTIKINTRHKDNVVNSLINEAHSYINYLNNAPDESHLLAESVVKLKQLESLRNISIMDYVDDNYKQLLRTAGY